MKRSTAIEIFKWLIAAILVLILALAIAISMLVNNTAKLEKAEQDREIVKNNARAYIEDVEFAYEHFDLEYVGEYKLTAYCTEKYKHICGEGHGITASGQPVQAGVSVAVGDTEKFPYGTVLYIEGVGIRIVQDTGGGLKDNQIDVAMDTHENALYWGNQGEHRVYVVKVGDEQ